MGGRRQQFKEPKPGLYILGEGLTEKYYFEHLKRLFNFRCIIKPRFFCNDCISKFEKEIEKLLRGDINIICVFDEDVTKRNANENQKLIELRKKYRQNRNILFCGSMPSIEYWFLIHFKDTCPLLTYSIEAERALRKYIVDYEKSEDFLKNEKWVKDMSFNNGSIVKARQRALKYKNSKTSYTKINKALDKLDHTLD